MRLPKDFAVLEGFISGTGPAPDAVWIPYGRVRDRSAPSDLITIGGHSSQADYSAIETVKISSARTEMKPKEGFYFSAELLDSSVAESFPRTWSSIGQIPIGLQDALGPELERTVELRGMKPAVDKVFARCGRDPL